jgi:hypothetical protein
MMRITNMTMLAPATLPTTLPTTTGVDGADDFSDTESEPAVAVAAAGAGAEPAVTKPGIPATVAMTICDDELGEYRLEAGFVFEEDAPIRVKCASEAE